MSQILVSIPELEALNGALAKSAASIAELLPVVSLRIQSAREALVRRAFVLKAQIEEVETQIRAAEEDDRDRLLNLRSSYQRDLEEVEGWAHRIEDRDAQWQAVARRLEALATQRTPQMRQLLGRHVERLRAASGVPLPDIGGSSIPAATVLNGGPCSGGSCSQATVGPCATGSAGARRGREANERSNFAWIRPCDVDVRHADSLEWKRISRETAQDTIRRVERLRGFFELSELSERSALRDRLCSARDDDGARLLSEEDVNVFDWYFGLDAVRLDTDGAGHITVTGGRHRLMAARDAGVDAVPVSLSNSARAIILDRIAREGK